MLACVELQRATWGDSFSEVVPPAILWVAQQTGGIASGAFAADGRLDGFVFGITGLRDGAPVHWSDMLAVRDELRGHGLGVALKLHQRDLLLAAGVPTVLWTFDPLEARNAHVNFARLGTTASVYLRDVYGDTGATLHAGIGTDRLVADWQISSDRVAARLAGRDAPPLPADVADAPLVNPTRLDSGLLRCDVPDLDLDAPRVRVAVPADVQALKRASLDVARDWRAKTRAALEAYLARGFRVVEFVREEEGGCYLLALTAFES